ATETVTPVEPPEPAVREVPEPAPKVAAKPKQQLKPKALAQPKSKRALQVKAKPPVVASTADANKSSHQVAKGETLYRIAKRYGISVEKLQQLNGMKKGDVTIQSGRKLIVSP
ncbi:MAG: LysM peptidoglycan-binding domain-containing protein, partial [Desulfosalsimonadaceae bacterium]|nr:LysM peptidoglycan-binding domain-containing protein [Desulfosalsimonadaceae bacterium]